VSRLKGNLLVDIEMILRVTIKSPQERMHPAVPLGLVAGRVRIIADKERIGRGCISISYIGHDCHLLLKNRCRSVTTVSTVHSHLIEQGAREE
jgi:hypothetical protein